MSTKKVADFFKNKVTVRLKDGNQFRGLLNKIDNKQNVVVMEDLEDLGNAYDKQQIPHDKKIAEKIFEAEQLEEIILADRVFADPKKYNPDDFFDSMTEQKEERQRGNKNRGGRNNRGSNYRGGYRGGNRDRDR